MSDLTEYDREIIAAANDLAEWIDQQQRILSGQELRLIRAVQAKRDAQRPKCGFVRMERPWGMCGERATQEILMPPDGTKTHRCDEHRIEVREL